MRLAACCLTGAILLWLGLSPALAKLPETMDEFTARLAEEGTTPEKATHLWFEALYVFMSDDEETSQPGAEMMTALMCDPDWQKNLTTFLSQIEEKPYIAFSYPKGATPENDYQFDKNDFELEFTRSTKGPTDKDWTLFVKCGGADTPRPYKMKQSADGIWQMYEFSSLYVGVKKPASLQ